jgi:hypothetical protein
MMSTRQDSGVHAACPVDAAPSQGSPDPAGRAGGCKWRAWWTRRWRSASRSASAIISARSASTSPLQQRPQDLDDGEVLLLGHAPHQQPPRRLGPLQQPGMEPGSHRRQPQHAAFAPSTQPRATRPSMTRSSAPGSSARNGARASATAAWVEGCLVSPRRPAEPQWLSRSGGATSGRGRGVGFYRWAAAGWSEPACFAEWPTTGR